MTELRGGLYRYRGHVLLYLQRHPLANDIAISNHQRHIGGLSRPVTLILCNRARR
jgi:hypothetical protein